MRWDQWLVGMLFQASCEVGVKDVMVEVLHQGGRGWVDWTVLVLVDCRVQGWVDLGGVVAGARSEPAFCVWFLVQWRWFRGEKDVVS